ncbi:hypothetical protein TSUD_394110 [Trifolium subterraneum]|uniref:Integrase catalytic domain-containing protein n=1 Tax=Trifolium subterraneum TaxID=3900 RepID=A0A2Z6NDZ4_TRISU|nr:hypothetical protein TSUD_394110 [Trifolium subterraneum]
MTTLNAGGPVLMPVDDNDQLIPETDHRDGRETSPESDDEDAVQFLSERKKGKQSQIAPGKSATAPQPNSPRVTENAALLDALCETIRTVNEAERSESPPARRVGTSQRRPVLERFQPQVQKRNRTLPREDSVAQTNKRGKAIALFEQRPRSPPWRKEIRLGGMTQGSRGDDYQYRRENSPRREETPTHSPGLSDDEVYKSPLSRQIMDLELPRALQKPPQLGKYDGLTDPDIHIQNIDAILNYQAVRGGIKCRIFPTTLVEGAMAWYRSLPQGSITSWNDLCKQFTSHFTASRKHPKTEANLESVRQGPNETLRSYIERFNKEVVQVDVTDDMKKYLMRKNLRDGTKFKEMVAIEKPATWDEILYKAQAYMQFEEETMADAMRYSRTEDNHPPREQGNKNGDKRNGDRRGHCIQLNDAIEILIRNGKLKDYVKRKENPRQEKKREDTPDEEPKASGEKNVALAIWRPEDLYTMVISGGVFDKHIVGSVKRKFEELITAYSGMAVTLGKPKTSSFYLSFTKWVEAEPLSEITSFRILRFFKRDILCRFGIPQAVVTDNGTQFTDKTFRGFLAKINTKHHFTSVEHPQTNGQAEAANRVILRGLRRRLGDAKKQWVEELPHVLWAYRTTPHSTTGETPFRLAYGTEAVIPVEIGEPSCRTEAPLDEEMNDKTDNGAYHLETLQGKEIPRTWNAQKHPRSSKILMVNSELRTRAEPLPDEDNSGNELHRRRAITKHPARDGMFRSWDEHIHVLGSALA